MKEKLTAIESKAKEQMETVESIPELEEILTSYLGKKGELTQILRGMKDLSPEEKPVVGAMANAVRENLGKLYDEKKQQLEAGDIRESIEREYIDITLNQPILKRGHRHPLIQVKEELEDLFIEMGFVVLEGPEIDSVLNNFDALNSPKTHPSRSLSDTFYITDETLLRTHTSTVQIRGMKEHGVPIKMVSSGRVFRYDEVDATHSPMFHQFEGMVIDKDISFANLKASLEIFIKELFGEDMKVRFRPHYFPFTEPSTEVDVTCFKCHGEGCPYCNYTGWSMELLGAGMVHPNVLRNCGVDPEVYSGFAFGMGIDRIAMVKYGIDDIRRLFENDVRFLEQF